MVKVGRPKGYKVNKVHRWSTEEKSYLKDICPGRSHKEIAMLMSNRFKNNFKPSQIMSAIHRYGLSTGRTGQFEKGLPAWNKGLRGHMGANRTSFKKGNVPQNRLPVGSERADNRDGCIRIKIAEPDKWELKHKFIYEKHHGKIKKDSVVIFLDGDKNNFDISNLKCITRKQLLFLNRHNLRSESAELTKLGIEVANLIIKTSEAKKKIK